MMKFDCELRTLERPGGVVVLAHGSGVTRECREPRTAVHLT